MSLRNRLTEILPTLLPAREEEAIKGRELIERVRAVLGSEYSDRTLRSQFSLIALEPDSCLARVPNGQGYYLRRPGDDKTSLLQLFGSGAEAEREGRDALHKVLALAVRLYDTAGLGVFVFPVEDESWEHPDLVAVQWPAGHREASGAYVIDETEAAPEYRAVCVGCAEEPEDCRRAFYRALSCGLAAGESELLLLPGSGNCDELADLAARFGVGVRVLEADERLLRDLPRADEIFRMGSEEARDLLASIPMHTVALPRHRAAALDSPSLAVVHRWAGGCVQRGRVEACEQRVAVN